MVESINIENENRERAIEVADAPRKKLAAAIRKVERLLKNFEADSEKHGDPNRWRKYGELLLANLANAHRSGDVVTIKDLYTEGEPEIEIIGESRFTLNEIAEDYFKRYAKARNAAGIIAERSQNASGQLELLRSRLLEIDNAVEAGDVEFLRSLTEKPKAARQQSKKAKQEQSFKGVRRFVSSDGFEIWVGKKATDNDHLTFRMARSLETWLHTADYPGSHVVIRDSGKKLVPEQTLIEAAQLAAFYSNAREHGKASVRYTQRKFVHKPKKAPAGMVSLSSFKTLVVEPGVNVKLKE